MHFFKITIALFIMICFVGGAKASNTATLMLRGNIPSLMSISVNPTPEAQNLDLTSTQTDLLVARVQEVSNSNTGYSISVSSQNTGNLVHTDNSANIPYTMKYDGQVLNLESTATISHPSVSAVSQNKDIEISYTGQSPEEAVAGDYEDTITFSISAN